MGRSRWFARSAEQGIRVAFFMTESRRDIAAVQAGARVPSVLLQSSFNGPERIRPDTPGFSGPEKRPVALEARNGGVT
jgi:hypothetical protein